MRRASCDVAVRTWEAQPKPCGPVQCMLCRPGKDFDCREDLPQHISETHGGRQRYRNAYLCLMQLAPHIVSGQEWRVILANYTEFYCRSANDWEQFTPEMKALLTSGQGIPRELR